MCDQYMKTKGRTAIGRKLLAIVMALALIMQGVVPMGAAGVYAAEADNQGAYPAMNEDGVYEIYNADQLLWFSTLVNGKALDEAGEAVEKNDAANAKLMADIDMSTLTEGKKWVAIGSTDYNGIFDGNGKSITIDTEKLDTGKSYVLFRDIASSATVKNFNVSGTITFPSNTYSSINVIANSNYGVVSGIVCDVTLTTPMGGAFFSYNYGAILNCGFKGNIGTNSSGSAMAAFVEYNQDGGVIKNCYNTGMINPKSSNYAGGIAAYTYGGAIDNVYNAGYVGVADREPTAGYHGSIVGGNWGGTITNAYNVESACSAAFCGTGTTEGASNVESIDIETMNENAGIEGLFSADDTDNPINGGYPVFQYELDRTSYPDAETVEGLGIASIETVEDTSLTVIFNKVLTYLQPNLNGFTMECSQDGGESWMPVTIASNGRSFDKSTNTVTLPYSSLQEVYALDHTFNLLVKVSYGETSVTGAIELTPSKYRNGYYAVPEMETTGEYKDYYKITNAEELTGFALLVDGQMSGKAAEPEAKAYLAADIDMTKSTDAEGNPVEGLIWKDSMGNGETPFCGILDGNGHTIEIILADSFCYANEGVIKNLFLQGTWDSTQKQKGFFVQNNNGLISGCSVDMDFVNVAGSNSYIAYYNLEKGRIAYSKAEGTIPAEVSSVSFNGIAYQNKGGVVYACYSDLKDESTSGFVYGLMYDYSSDHNGQAVVENCYSVAHNDNHRGMYKVFNTSQNPAANLMQLWEANQLRNNYMVAEDTDQSPVTNHSFKYVNSGYQYLYDMENYRTVATLKAADLGDAYVDPENGGLPVLSWEIEKDGVRVYPEAEQDLNDVTIESIDSFSAEKTVITIDKSYVYTPVIFSGDNPDFKVYVTFEGSEEEIEATLVDAAVSGNQVTLQYMPLVAYQAVEDQKVIVRVEPNTGTAKTEEKVLKGATYYDENLKEPELIEKGDRKYNEFAGYYKLTSPEEVVWFAYLVNGKLEDMDQDRSAKAFLANDIYFNDPEAAGGWESWYTGTEGLMQWREKIGNTEESTYNGIFDGNGYAFRGLFLTRTEKSPHVSPFGYLGSGYVKNLSVEESYYGSATKETIDVGGIFTGTLRNAGAPIVENCHFAGIIDCPSAKSAGGIAGCLDTYSDKYILECSNRGIIIGGVNVGGIAGASSDGKIENCYSTGMLSGIDVSAITNNCTVTNCYSVSNALSMANASSGAPSNGWYLEGTLRTEYGFFVTPDEYTYEASAFTQEDVDNGALVKYLGDAFVADTENINGGYPILRGQTPAGKAADRAALELETYLEADDYSENWEQIEKIMADAMAEIEAIQAAGGTAAEVNAVLAKAKADMDVVDSDEDIFEKQQNNLNKITQEEQNKADKDVELKQKQDELAKEEAVANADKEAKEAELKQKQDELTKAETAAKADKDAKEAELKQKQDELTKAEAAAKADQDAKAAELKQKQDELTKAQAAAKANQDAKAAELKQKQDELTKAENDAKAARDAKAAELKQKQDELADKQAALNAKAGAKAFKSAKAAISVKKTTYNGKAKKPSVTVKLEDGTKLKKGTDYTVTYSGNKKPGIVKVTIKGKGDYSGTKTLTFKILPKKQTVKSVKAQKKAFTVKWKSDKTVTGYQIQYAKTKNFKAAKNVTIKKNTTISKKVKSLQSGKKYYVKMRAYKTVNGQKIYGNWSKVKTVKVK